MVESLRRRTRRRKPPVRELDGHVHRRRFETPNGELTVKGVCLVDGCPDPVVELPAVIDYQARYHGPLNARGAKLSEARRRGLAASMRSRGT